MNDSKEVLYGVLYYALLDIRYDAREAKDNKIFAITHALHNLPLKLMKANSEEDYDELLRELDENIKDNIGLTNLVNSVKSKVNS